MCHKDSGIRKRVIFMKITTLEQALKRIEKLEKQNAKYLAELEQLRKIKPAGRRLHDEKWMNSYNHFVSLHEAGLSIDEILEKSEFSRRTAYRYREYYNGLKNKKKKSK